MKTYFCYKNDHLLAVFQQMCRQLIMVLILILSSAVAFADTSNQGLVLSGGGAKGSFEIGALQYMYENDFCAKVICSTSVGSVNAIQLAHGGTKATQKAAFDKLKTIWKTELTFNQDMYVEAPWLQGVSSRTRSTIASLFDPKSIDFPRLARDVVLFPPYAIGQAVVLGDDLSDGIEGLKGGRSVFTLDPTRDKIKRNLNKQVVANSGVQLRLVAVSLDSGAIRYITQDGHVQETDGKPVVGEDSTVCAAEQAAYDAANTAYETAQHDLLLAKSQPQENLDPIQAQKAFDKAKADRADAAGRLRRCKGAAAAAGTANSLAVDILDGVIASASIPCAFPPVVLGNETYVDGGIRWVLPLKAAMDFPNTEAIIAINASPAGVPPPKLAYRDATLLDIAERSVLDILLWEIQERHLEAAKNEAFQRKKSVWVVTPRVDVHDTLTIDPGLIDINIGYGYMCAADVLKGFPFLPTLTNLVVEGIIRGVTPGPDSGQAQTQGKWVTEAADPALASLADAITKCRRRCWELEYDVFGARQGEAPFEPKVGLVRVPSPDALDEVRLFKSLLGVLVAARNQSNGKLPSDATTWANSWEGHRWKPNDVPGVGNTPWSAFQSHAGTRPAAPRPTTMVVKAPGRDEVYLLTPLKCWITSPQALARVTSAAPVEFPAEYLDAIPKGPDIQ